MPKKATSPKNTFRIFIVFCAVVLILILSSFAIKTVFVIKESKFDGTHRFTLVFSQNQKVNEVVSFNPQTTSASILTIKDSTKLTLSTIARTLGIASDAVVTTNNSIPDTTNINAFSSQVLFNTNFRSSLSLFDKLRLFLLTQKIQSVNVSQENISLPMDMQQLDKVISELFTDATISQENISIEIINGSGVAGIGTRLERILNNMGANVVSVSTSRDIDPDTYIAYYGNESYTLHKLMQIFQMPSEKLTQKSIADIVITIGRDSTNTTLF